MIKIPYEQFANGMLIASLQQVMTQIPETDEVDQVMSFSKALDAHKNKYMQKLGRLSEEFGERDENGQLVKSEEGYVRVAEDKRPAFKKEYDQLLKEPITFQHGLPLSFVRRAKLSAIQLATVSDLIHPQKN